ncbi:MAG: aldehyde dehydrogenase family protein [Acidobacteria bacterium]|nr:aldehyde dehydrogenase family protein [Acidobacteriota bacterium]
MLADKDLQSIQEVRTKVAAAHEAFLQFRPFTQEQVDRIIDHVAAAARANAESLAKLAVEETGYGNVRDKTIKNLLTSDLLHRAIRPMKTVGIIREDRANGIIEIAEPVGVVAAILPTTNPTSTAFFKILIALKGRNAIVVSPHPRAVNCTCESARILAEAAEQAGAPKGIVQCLTKATIEGTNELIKHRRTSLILSTGGPGIVRAAYSSGKPALGVGPGNVAVLLDDSADIDEAIGSVIDGKSFDYGTVCSSEQCVVTEEKNRDAVFAALGKHGAYLCNAEQTDALARLLITKDFRVNAECVGQSPQRIAKMAGFSVSDDVRALVVELKGVGREHPLSAEKLSPVLSVYFARDFAEALKVSAAIVNFGGRGHTCVIYSKNEQRIREFGLTMPAFRVLVNTPSPQGSTGITTNVLPSMTLGCGAIAGNITGDNVGPMHLINIKRVAYKVRDVEAAFESEEARAFFAAPRRGAGSIGAGSAWAVSGGGTREPKVAAAVDQYLRQRGIDGHGSNSGARAALVARPAAVVVDRFLNGRHGTTPSQVSPRTSPVMQSKPEPKPPAPDVETVPFVSEDDVRRAKVLEKKIYINGKTIVTPAARDLDYDRQVMIRTD